MLRFCSRSFESLLQETVFFQFRWRFRWSRQKAVDFMVENTAMSLHNVNAEINRYIIWPGQVCLNSISVCNFHDLHNISIMLTFIAL